MMRPAFWPLFGILFPAAGVRADPRQIMDSVRARNAAPDERVAIRMRIVDADGQAKERTATYWAKRIRPSAPEQRKLIRFHSPPEMAKAGVLTHEKAGGEPDQWMFLPSVYASRRVPSSDRGDRYMGTTYAYEDIVSIRSEQYAFKTHPEESLEGKRCAVIEQVPVDAELKRESGYSRIVNWVEMKDFVILKSEYYDRSGALWKRYEASGMERHGGYIRPAHTEMRDLKAKRTTIIDYSRREIGAGLADGLFTVRNLERGD